MIHDWRTRAAGLRAAVDAALNGMKQIASTGEQLMPVMFGVAKDGSVRITGWAAEEKPYDHPDKVREVLASMEAVAGCFVVEALALDNNGTHDIAVLYSYWPERNRENLTTFFIRDGQLIYTDKAEVEEKYYAWFRDAITDQASA